MAEARFKGKRSSLFLITFLIVTFNSLYANNEPIQTYHLLSGSSFVQSKNYYLLTLFEELADVKKLLSDDTILLNIERNKTADLTASLKNCDKAVVSEG